MSRRWHRPHWARSEYWEDRLSRQKAKDSSSSNSGNLNDGENLQTPGRTGAAETEAPGSGTRRRASSSDQHRPSLSLASFSEESRPSSPANVFALTGDSGSFIAANVEDVAGKARKMRSPLQSTPEIFGASIGSDSPTQGDFSIHATIGSRRSTGRYGEPGQLHVPALMYEGTTISDITCNTPYVVVPDAGQGLISGVLAAGEVLTQDTRDDQEEAGHDEILLKQPPQPEISLQPINSVIHDKLWKERRQSASGSYNWFIPQKRTKTIMRLEDVSALLRELGPGIGNDEQRLKIARQICGVHEERDGQMREASKPASKYQAVLAALVLCRKHAHIVAFLKHRVDDLSLPLLRQYPGSTEDYSLVSHNNLDERLPIFDMWSPSEIDSFYRQQWELIPTQFRKEGKRIPHHELRADHILPYEQDPNECNNDETEEDMEDRRGHYGQVSIYNLHKDQQTLDRYTVDGENGRIAVKKLNSKDPKDFFNESDVLMRLSSARKHTPHLARLLATYQQPSGPNRSSMEFFLMFECAESNLERFWANSPRSLLDKYQLTQCQLTKWVAYQCVGLADALATLHRLPKIPEQAEKNPATHGLHGDLKPANILRYTNWQDPSDPLRPLYAPLGVLQITDFGLSSLHHTDTMEDIKIKIGASPYKPPETQLVTPISQSLDIWMLGCLFLDFVTWLLNGAEGQRRFEEKRMERRGLINHAHPCFFEVYEDLDKWTHVCVSKPVLDWAKKLCKSKRSSQFVCDFVHLILKHMLVIEDKLNLSDLKVARKASQVSSDEPVSSRVGANELVAKMAELISNDDSYYTQVREQPDWKRLAQLGCVIKIHKSMKEVTNDADHRRKRMKAAGEDGVIRLGPSRQATDKTDSSASTSYTFR